MDSKNTVQQGLVSKVKSLLKRRKVLCIAVFILKLLKVVYRVYEYFTS